MKTRFFIGPMSKNIVDSIIKFNRINNENVGIIPSRRQIEFDGGYCNHWTTEDLRKYSPKLLIQRDHAGPGQGDFDDNGYKSLEEDCKYMDLIHIDPWKKYPNYKEGLRWTIEMIEFCYEKNKKIMYEVGTEESIRKFDSEELDKFMNDLSNKLSKEIYKKIKYLVIQSGTSLNKNSNSGKYNKLRLQRMISVCKKYNLLSKEHNGDYIPESLIRKKMELGLDSINIAPEFGLIETNTYLKEISDNTSMIEEFWKICYDSNRWVKWVNKDFDPIENKVELIKICGHYVLSSLEFNQKIKINFENIDEKIIKNITTKLNRLHGYKT